MRSQDAERELVRETARLFARDVRKACRKVARLNPGWTATPDGFEVDVDDRGCGVKIERMFAVVALERFAGGDAASALVTLYPNHERGGLVFDLQEAINARLARLALEWAVKRRDADGLVRIDNAAVRSIGVGVLFDGVCQAALCGPDGQYDLVGALTHFMEEAVETGTAVDGMQAGCTDERTLFRVAPEATGGGDGE